MRIETESRTVKTVHPWLWTLALLLVGLGCQSAGSGRLAPVETRDVNGFSITEASSVAGDVRADFDEANRAIDAADFERAVELLESVTLAAPTSTGVERRDTKPRAEAPKRRLTPRQIPMLMQPKIRNRLEKKLYAKISIQSRTETTRVAGLARAARARAVRLRPSATIVASRRETCPDGKGR